MNKDIIKLRIHGDNILECENTLKLLVSSLRGDCLKLKSSPAYVPVYTLKSDNGETFDIQLFAGYGRWKFPLTNHIASLGGMLREAPDAIVTRIKTVNGKNYEKPILALEFSGALPAGNNAWQRTGRALALAHAKIPYLYFAELGGQELDSARNIKAARFPNPLVPFAYLVLGMSTDTVSLPIYMPSSSSNKSITEVFNNCFGAVESIRLVREILLSKSTKKSQDLLERKVLKVLKILSQLRKRNDILEPEEWVELYSQKSGIEKAKWLISKGMTWNKKTGIKTLTITFKRFLGIAKKCGAVAIGSKEMPICLIPAKKRKIFAKKMKDIYKTKINKNFINWLSTDSYPLICVWIAGFKPRGDDSRPDRGLIPLARMIFGIEGIDLLTVVYGPAKTSTWEALKKDMHRLATINGLWEAIVNLSNGIIVDSNTSEELEDIGFLTRNQKQTFKEKLLPAASENPVFGEHDIDSVLHLLFSYGFSKKKIHECMCNPPGGDWSGINILKTEEKIETRWTSLPRVSGIDSKRPDHLIQFLGEKTLLSIESKNTAIRLESGIGPRLINYTKALLKSAPIAFRSFGTDKWERYEGTKIEKLNLISGGAFQYVDKKNLKDTLNRSKVDIVFGIEFNLAEKKTTIHILSNSIGKKYVNRIKELAAELSDFIQVQIHQ